VRKILKRSLVSYGDGSSKKVTCSAYLSFGETTALTSSSGATAVLEYPKTYSEISERVVCAIATGSNRDDSKQSRGYLWWSEMRITLIKVIVLHIEQM
jgi:hypothetical protein